MRVALLNYETISYLHYVMYSNFTSSHLIVKLSIKHMLNYFDGICSYGQKPFSNKLVRIMIVTGHLLELYATEMKYIKCGKSTVICKLLIVMCLSQLRVSTDDGDYHTTQ